jgi:hypothetical protein
MAITVGARRGVIEKLRWTDIDFTNKKVFLGDTKNGAN